MDVVLEKIQYNPDCFSKIVEDFEAFVKHTESGCFQKELHDITKSGNYSVPPRGSVVSKIRNKKHGTRDLSVKKQVLLLFGRFCRRQRVTRRRAI